MFQPSKYTLVHGLEQVSELAHAMTSAYAVSMHLFNAGVSADVLLASLEKMRTSKVWAPVFATLLEVEWYGAHSTPGIDHQTQLQHLLANALASKEQTSKVLSPAVAQRLQACFSKMVCPLL